MNNIILIGMPGSGKSTVGVVLAKTIMFGFCDTDLLIQEQTGQLLQDIIKNEGLEKFIEAETRAVSSLSYARNIVIATGGSVILSRDAMEHLKRLGTLVYLNLPLREIRGRLRNITTRGIVMNPGETLEDIYKKRTPLYEKYADVTVNCSKKKLESIVSEIIRKCMG